MPEKISLIYLLSYRENTLWARHLNMGKSNKTNITGLTILIFFVAVGMAQILYYYPQLPEKLIMHWNWAGEADSWGPKSFMAILQLFILLLIGGIFWAGAVSAEFPGHGRKLPNQKYWLAAERIDQTFKVIGKFYIKTGSAFLIMMILNFRTAIIENLGRTCILEYSSLDLLAVFIAYSAFQYIKTYLYFRKVP